ncbi:conserved hypothetical protein [Pediculus humanus corporis]|uniref:Nose resistant-to-fluoxetine protein N-terminal domain-containing protein n=1 Tax=Pediculus humanus subsp. corporis TaxID=121224 RepID=E0VTE4_PEDHC|nr:uncharacterized protein Phum_PHUM431730 [Pediculus humanus corporis]EEB16650.1 conserved hypothetical protein [Pediculus humanus corporis]
MERITNRISFVREVFCNDYLKSQYPLYGLTEIATRKNTFGKITCINHLKKIYEGIEKHENWALELLDASGTPGGGLTWGNNYWLGKHSKCRFKTSNPVEKESTEFYEPPFRVGFRMSLFKLNNMNLEQENNDQHSKKEKSLDKIHLGLCLPLICNTDDLKPFLSEWGSYELKIDNSEHKPMPIHIIKTTPKIYVQEPKQNIFTGLSLCFSLKNNTKLLFSKTEVDDNNKELSIIHGIRLFGMTWLIWLYTIYYLTFHSDNKLNSNYTLPHVSLSTDTFLFTNGFSLAFKYYKYNGGWLKSEKKFSVKKKVNEFSFATLKRYLRLTPGYLITIGMIMISLKITKQISLFDMMSEDDETCRKIWWRNAIYINNLFKQNETCVSWSWFLAIDMQFFLLGLFILILSTRFWKFVSFLSVALIILSSAINGYYWKNHRELQISRDIFTFSPWSRIGPYLVGMICGYLTADVNKDLKFNRTTLIASWLLAILCGIWATFGNDIGSSMIFKLLYNAFSRTAWSLALAWIVFACCTDHGGFIKQILSFSTWNTLDKLFYPTYLLTPLIIILLVSNLENPIHLEFTQMIVYFFGSLTIIFISSFCFSLLIQIPFKTLQKKLMGQGNRQNLLNRST